MLSNKRIPLKYAESFIVITIWLVVFTLPLIILKENNFVSWRKVLDSWERIFPFFILFLINHFVLVPYLLFKAKKTTYFIIAGVLMVLLLSNDLVRFKLNESNRKNNITLNQSQPRQFQGEERRLPPPPRNRADLPPRDRRPVKHPLGLPPYLNSIFITLFIFGFDTGLRISLKWNETEREKSNLEKENMENQLAFLKHQVSPHFFMNTLNNIHSLIDIDTEEAKESIIKLSKLMRYLLYDTDGGKVLLSKEVEFIQSYVNLMKLRYSEKVKIELIISDNIPEKKIHPMLFISLIENAFKHGISYQEESFVKIEMALTESTILFEINNSKPKHMDEIESSGIGMQNTRKRLDLLYTDSYLMNVWDTDDSYKVSVTIPI